MDRKIIIVVSVLLLLSAWVVGVQMRQEEETCYTRSDPKATFCLVEEEPLDFQVENRHQDPHNISVEISNSSGSVYSKTLMVGRQEERPLEDVIGTPGEYQVQAALNTGQSDSMELIVDERYCKDCLRLILVTADGNIEVKNPPSQ